MLRGARDPGLSAQRPPRQRAARRADRRLQLAERHGAGGVRRGCAGNAGEFSSGALARRRWQRVAKHSRDDTRRLVRACAAHADARPEAACKFRHASTKRRSRTCATLATPTFAVVLARSRDGVVLVFNRYRKVWELPGGLIDPGESARDSGRARARAKKPDAPRAICTGSAWWRSTTVRRISARCSPAMSTTCPRLLRAMKSAHSDGGGDSTPAARWVKATRRCSTDSAEGWHNAAMHLITFAVAVLLLVVVRSRGFELVPRHGWPRSHTRRHERGTGDAARGLLRARAQASRRRMLVPATITAADRLSIS